MIKAIRINTGEVDALYDLDNLDDSDKKDLILVLQKLEPGSLVEIEEVSDEDWQAMDEVETALKDEGHGPN